MENGNVKNIVLIAVVVIFSFFVGSLSVDGLKTALMPIAVIGGAFFMLYLGKNSKFLIFYFPLFANYLPFNMGPLGWTCPVAAGVFIYWIFLRFLGHVRMEWVGHPACDTIIGIFFVYMCICFYRNPVAIKALGLDLDMMGGLDYVGWLLGTIAYVGISLIPFDWEELCKIVKRTIYILLALSCYGILLKLTGKGGGTAGGESGLGEEAQNSRFTLFSGLGSALFSLIYMVNPLRKLLTSPGKIIVMLLCLLAVFLSGWRGTIIGFACIVFFLAFLKRELSFILFIGGLIYGGLLFLSSEHALENLPFGIQRSLCAIPGVHVSKRVEADATGSSDWRKEMWVWALDPRTHYIKDYVWGDGPGISESKNKRFRTAVLRRKASGGDNRHFAATGVWHSGWISFMHRYGIIGLVLSAIYFTIYFLIAFLLCLKYRSTQYFPYMVIYCSGALPGVILYYLSAGSPIQVFTGFPIFAIFKQLYIRAREIGRDDSFFRSEPYTPLMIQDIQAKEEEVKSPYVNA